MRRSVTYTDTFSLQTNTTDLVLYGADGGIVVDPGEVVTDLYGLSTVTAVLKIPCDQRNLIPHMYSRHPTYNWAGLERRRVKTEKGYFIVTADYAGVDTSEPIAKIAEVTVGVQDEPIVSHPNFVSGIGGRPSAPLNGAVFLDPDGNVTTDDDIGQFAYFRVGSSFAGIESYLAADFVTYRIRFVTNSVFFSGVGHISSPIGGDYMGPPSATNWLFISANVEQRGLAFTCCFEWRAGGRRGWNSAIYG